MASLHPPGPRRAKTRPFPSFVSRFVKTPQRTPEGRPPVLAHLRPRRMTVFEHPMALSMEKLEIL